MYNQVDEEIYEKYQVWLCLTCKCPKDNVECCCIGFEDWLDLMEEEVKGHYEGMGEEDLYPQYA